MKCILVLLSCVCLVSAQIRASQDETFAAFKQRYHKSYRNPDEEQHRAGVYEQNLKFIRKFNEESSSFSVAMNHFGDLTSDEFAAFYTGVDNEFAALYTGVDKSPRSSLEQTDIFSYISPIDPPVSVDWRNNSIITPVKNQGRCNCSWAIASSGALEGVYALTTGVLQGLSAQQLIDCDPWNHGCADGIIEKTYLYLFNTGLELETDYPFTASQGSCKLKGPPSNYTIKMYVSVNPGEEYTLMVAVANFGPVAATIDASQPSFQFYESGVYYDRSCSREILTQGVLIVGYGTETDNDYWIVRNSWGTSWGMEGYMHLARNRRNMCGISTRASYPILHPIF